MGANSWCILMIRSLISSLRLFWVGVKRHTHRQTQTVNVSMSPSNKQSTLATSAEHRGSHTRKRASTSVFVCVLWSVGEAKKARWTLTTYTNGFVMAKLSSITTLFVGHPFNGHNTELLICRLPLLKLESDFCHVNQFFALFCAEVSSKVSSYFKSQI